VNFILKYKYSLLLIVILLAGLFIRFKLSQDDFLHKWDERYHALVSKNLLLHPLKPTLYEDAPLEFDYKQWYSNHIWLHKQPLPLWLIAGSYKLFGISEFITRLPSLMLSGLAIFLTYLLGKLLFNKKVGLLGAFFFAVNGLIIEMGAGRVATDHYDILFLVFIEIAVLFAYHNSISKNYAYAILSGLFVSFAVLTKWLPGLIVLPIHYFFLLNAGFKPIKACQQIGASALASILVALPWQLYILHNFPIEAKWEYYHNWLHVSTELDGQSGGFLYYLDKIRINYSEIIYIPLSYFIYTLHKQRYKDYKLISLAIWVLIPILFFSLVKTKMQGYILFISPALFIITAKFFFELMDELIPRFKNKILILSSRLVLVAIIVLPIRYCFERTGFGFKKADASDYDFAYKTVGMLPAKSVVINVKNPIEFMFYNNCTAYSNTQLSAGELNKIFTKGYKLFRYDPSTKKAEPVSF
jgi:4-amino-4-deoxy-L-arabinose transferase-like glycosyltransferase